MDTLKELEQNNREYADVIDKLITQPYTNAQLVDLCHTIAVFLRANAYVLNIYNEQIEMFKGLMTKLP